MRSLLLIALALMIACGACRAETAEPPKVEARGAVLLDGRSGRVLFAQNMDEPLPMASTTKIMTALLTYEHCALDEVVTVPPEASGVPGTSLYLSAGEALSVHDLLLGLLLRSGNDAAVALAHHIAGDTPSFVAMMNDRAREMDLDAHFENPHGLDADGHAASARAMAELARVALRIPAFRETVSTKRATIPWAGNAYDRALTNKNKLLTRFAGATGVKTGFTKRAGRCLVFSAERSGMELVGTLLGAPNWFADAEALLTWAFERYKPVSFLYANQTVGEIPVRGGVSDHVEAVAGRALIVPIAGDEAAAVDVELAPALDAPVAMGDVVGLARVTVGEQTLVTEALYARESVPVMTYFAALAKIARGFNPLVG